MARTKANVPSAYSSFLEWNEDPEIASAAEKLYGSIDKLELYVGLQAEQAKPVIPGAGLCPGKHTLHNAAFLLLKCLAAYTVSRAILADAIALTRGDRFFTSEYTPYNLTAWGYADCQRDADGPGNGSILGRLLLRTLEQRRAQPLLARLALQLAPALRPVLFSYSSSCHLFQ